MGIDSFEKIRKCGFYYVDKTNLIEQLLESWEEVNQLTRSRDGKESMQMAEPIKLPVGIESFSEIRETGFYYVDKTKLVEQLLDQWGKVNLFTRPRRFGKTLNMSMLRNFFEIGADKSLFDGLYISRNQKLCETYQGKYPVVFLSLKNVDGLTFEEAKYRMTELIGMEAERFSFLLDSEQLSVNEKKRYQALTEFSDGRFTMDNVLLSSSLQVLSQLLCRHYGRKTIILIDEYDVPLDKAFQHGYYKEMVALIRGLFGQALKTNDSLQFAVLTGCLRISKESIFTGLNNFKVLSIADARFDEQCGFTEDEAANIMVEHPEYVEFLQKVGDQYQLNQRAVEQWTQKTREQTAAMKEATGESINMSQANTDILAAYQNLSNNNLDLQQPLQEIQQLNDLLTNGAIANSDFLDRLNSGFDTLANKISNATSSGKELADVLKDDDISNFAQIMTNELYTGLQQANKQFKSGKMNVTQYSNTMKKAAQQSIKMEQATSGLTDEQVEQTEKIVISGNSLSSKDFAVLKTMIIQHKLTEVDIENTATAVITTQAFEGCSNLVSIKLPKFLISTG